MMTTEEATPEVISNADLIVVGAPVLGFRLATDAVRAGLAGELDCALADSGRIPPTDHVRLA